MKILLVFHWDSSIDKDCMPDPFYKVVEMPCLPPVGTTVEIWDDQADFVMYDPPLIVKNISWAEDLPNWFAVNLQLLVLDMTLAEVEKCMVSSGWTWCDMPDEVNAH